MESEWPIVTVESIAKKVASGPFGSNLRGSEYVQAGVPVIRGGNLAGPRFTDEGYVYVTDAKAESLSSSLAYPLDIVFTARGSVGAVGLVPQGQHDRYLLSSNLVKVTVDSEKADPRFVFYYFRSWRGQHEILAHVNTTGVPKIERALESLRSFRLPRPPLQMQQAIACILGALDDKIELNRRMNETLEGMARAIFKSWFVDFDPVRTKAAGQQPPGLAPHIADLFPDDFEVSELGEIPRGWEVSTLGTITNEVRDTVQPADIEPGTPYIALEHMPRRSIALNSWGVADDIASAKLRFRAGDILFGKLRPYFHKVGPAPLDGVCSTDIVVCRPQDDLWYGLTLGHMSSDAFVAHTDSGSTGTKMPRTNWRYMSAFKIALPPSRVVARFSGIVRPMINRIRHSIFEQQNLAALRDTLLPKLISGELRVPEAERFLTEVSW